MASLTHHFLAMAYNNAWANYRLLKACCCLSQADFVATRTSFFPSIKATLNHLLTVDWYYLDALERSLSDKPVNTEAWQFFEPKEPYAACQDLQQEQGKADQRLITVCQALTEANLVKLVYISRANTVLTEQVSRVLAHLFQHQIHHRGQVHAMLAGTPVAPPQLDEFFLAYDANLRESDFQELGFSETQIWPG